MRIYFKTFGCTANKADTIRMEQVLAGCGHTFTDNIEDAGLVVVNTCTVTATTQRNVLKFIHSVSESGKQVVAAGCLGAAQPENLEGTDCRIITPSSIEDIAEIVGGNSDATKKGTAPALDGITGIVSISQGCVGECSYCIVKLARGELVSRPLSDIVNEAGSLVRQGAMEIQLTSQDTAAYGLDSGTRLPQLLNALKAIDGDHMIRVGMMNPFTVIDIVDDVVDAFDDPHIFQFLHLPVQSGSDIVLEHMNRRHTVEDFKQIVHKFRDRFPDITLSTDFIVGYPAETPEDFNDTLKLLEEIKPRKVNITRYSPRPNTPASLMYDMPDWKKKERSRILTRTHHSINSELFRVKTGESTRILTTEMGRDNSTIGRDIHYNSIVVQEQLPLGVWYDVKITGSRTTYLISERITDEN